MAGVKRKRKRHQRASRKRKRARGEPCSVSPPPLCLPRPSCPAQPSFFKIMLANFEEALFIPPKLTNIFLGLVNQNVLLQDAVANIWLVKVSMIGNYLAFKEGWEDFVLDHSIGTGEFLVFRYVGKALFSVEIYGTNACEKVNFDKRGGNNFSKVNISEANLSKSSQFAKRGKITIASEKMKDSEKNRDPSNFAERPLENAFERVNLGERNDCTCSERNRDNAVLSPGRSLFGDQHKLVATSNCEKVSVEKYNPNSAKVRLLDSCERVGLGKTNDNSSEKKRKKTDERKKELDVASHSKRDSKEKHVPSEDASEGAGLGKRNDNNSSEKNRKKTDVPPRRIQYPRQCKLTLSSNFTKDLKEEHGLLENACSGAGFGNRIHKNSAKKNREKTDLCPSSLQPPTTPKAACTKFETNNQVTCSQEMSLDTTICKFLLPEDGICQIVKEDSRNRLSAVKVYPTRLSASKICTGIKSNDHAVSMSRDATPKLESVSNVNYVASTTDLEPEENEFKREDFFPDCLPSQEFSPLFGSVGRNFKEMPVTATTGANACCSKKDRKEDVLLRSQDLEFLGVEPMNLCNLYSSSSYIFSLTSAPNNQDWIELPRDLTLTKCRKWNENRAVILRDPSLRAWPILHFETVGFAGFTVGWNDFAKANNLRQGSKCEFFQLTGGFCPTFQVRISHPSS